MFEDIRCVCGNKYNSVHKGNVIDRCPSCGADNRPDDRKVRKILQRCCPDCSATSIEHYSWCNIHKTEVKR